MATTTTRDDVRARIVMAAARLLQEDGRAALTTRAVSERADVQPPTIYRLFGDKDGLLDAVAEHVLQTFVTVKVASNAAGDDDADPVEALRLAWDRQIDFGLANPEIFAILVDPARTSPAGEAGMRVLANRVHRIAADGRLRIGERRAAELIHAAGIGVTLTLLASHPSRRDRGLADSMYETVAARILTEPDDPERGDGDAAVVAAARGLTTLSAGERLLLEEWLQRS